MTVHPEVSHHNWLVHRIVDESLILNLRRYATGTLVDIGCGVKPYSAITQGLVTKHIGVDYSGTIHDASHVDIIGTAYETTLPDSTADTVLLTAVLEHLEHPQNALEEAQRILKVGGYLILTAPLFWHLHEEPRDFFRYTKYGLKHLLEAAGFEVVEIEPLGGFVVTFAQELCYFIEGRWNWPSRYPVRALQHFLQWGAYQAHRLGKDRSHSFTWAYLAVARKKQTALAHRELRFQLQTGFNPPN